MLFLPDLFLLPHLFFEKKEKLCVIDVTACSLALFAFERCCAGGGSTSQFRPKRETISTFSNRVRDDDDPKQIQFQWLFGEPHVRWDLLQLPLSDEDTIGLHGVSAGNEDRFPLECVACVTIWLHCHQRY